MQKVIIYTGILATPLLAIADDYKLGNPAPGAGTTLQEFILLLIEIVQLVTTPALVICLIYSGFLFVTASGNLEQVTKAKQWALWTLVGAAIVLGATVIAQAIFNTADALK